MLTACFQGRRGIPDQPRRTAAHRRRLPTAGDVPTAEDPVKLRRSVTGGDRGSATVELAVLFPVFLALVFGGVQAAEWYHVRSLCLAAADAGVQTGRTTGATDADARQTAVGFLTRAAGGTADAPAVSTAGSSPAVVRVEVSASVPRVLPLPGLKMRVTQSSRATREVFTTGNGQP